MRQDLLRGPLRNDASSVLARCRPEVNHPVRFTDGLIVMFDDQHSISQVSQSLERVK